MPSTSKMLLVAINDSSMRDTNSDTLTPAKRPSLK